MSIMYEKEIELKIRELPEDSKREVLDYIDEKEILKKISEEFNIDVKKSSVDLGEIMQVLEEKCMKKY